MKKILNFLIFAGFLLGSDIYAGVILNVRAVNPLDIIVTEVIRYDLPIAIEPEHIKGFKVEGQYEVEIEIVGEGSLPAGRQGKLALENEQELEFQKPLLEQELKIPEPSSESKNSDYKILFDEEKDIYFIEVEVRFSPKGVISLTIDLEDVWNISLDKIKILRSSVPDVLEGDISSLSLRTMIFQQLDEIIKKQEESIVEKVGVKEHIEVYKKNRELSDQVENDIAMLEGLLFEQALEEVE